MLFITIHPANIVPNIKKAGRHNVSQLMCLVQRIKGVLAGALSESAVAGKFQRNVRSFPCSHYNKEH